MKKCPSHLSLPALFFMIFFLLYSFAGDAFGTISWTNKGPAGNFNYKFYDVAVDPTDSDRVYIVVQPSSCPFQLYRSEDGGDTWDLQQDSEVTWGSLSLSGDVHNLTISPTSPEVLYLARTSGAGLGGIWKGTQYGFLWEKIYTLGGSEYAAPTLSPNVLYMGGTWNDAKLSGHILGVTTDEGSTWKTFYSFTGDIPRQCYFNYIAVHPLSAEVACASGVVESSLYSKPCTSGLAGWAGIFVTTNEGKSWQRRLDLPYHYRDSNYYGPNTLGIHFNKSDPSEIVAMTKGAHVFDAHTPFTGDYYPVFIRSTDGGQNFVTQEVDTLPYANVTLLRGAFCVDPQDFDKKYFAHDGIYYSEDPDGLAWSPRWTGFPSKPRVQDMAVSESSPGVVYTVSDHGVYKSTNRGASWQSKNSGLFGTAVHGLRLSAATPGFMYAIAGSDKVARSSDFAGIWNYGQSFYHGTSKIVATVDPSYAGTIYIYSRYSWPNGAMNRSDDYGDTFYKFDLDAQLGTWETVRIFEVDPGSSEVIYCQIGALSTEAANPRLIKTTNTGGSWSTLTSGFSEEAGILAIDPVDPQIMYRSSRTTPFIHLGWSVKKSVDGGNNWTDISSNFPGGIVTAAAMAIDPKDPQKLYVADRGWGTQQKVYKSLDGGSSFSYAGSFLFIHNNLGVVDLVVNPVRTNIIYVLLDDNKLYRSTDNAGTWQLVNGSLSNPIDPALDPVVNELGVDPKADMLIYAATNLGIYTAVESEVPIAPTIEAIAPYYAVNLNITRMRLDGTNFMSPYVNRVYIYDITNPTDQTDLDFTVQDPLTVYAEVPAFKLPGTFEVRVEAIYPSGTFTSNAATFEIVGASPDGPEFKIVKFDYLTYLSQYAPVPVSKAPGVLATVYDPDGINETGFSYIWENQETLGQRQVTDESVFDYTTKEGTVGTMEGDVTFTIDPPWSSGNYRLTIIAKDKATSEVYPEGNIGAWSGYVEVEVGPVRVIGEVLNYPTVFKPLSQTEPARIAYNLSRNAATTVFIYDVAGQVVLTKKFPAGDNGGRAGYNDFTWNGISDFGSYIGNGIYVIKITSGNKGIGTGKLVVFD